MRNQHCCQFFFFYSPTYNYRNASYNSSCNYRKVKETNLNRLIVAQKSTSQRDLFSTRHHKKISNHYWHVFCLVCEASLRVQDTKSLPTHGFHEGEQCSNKKFHCWVNAYVVFLWKRGFPDCGISNLKKGSKDYQISTEMSMVAIQFS